MTSLSQADRAAFLDGWELDRRWYGYGDCFSTNGLALWHGKWGVTGSAGSYRVIRPNGWLEETPMFPTELEAMLWVLKQP